MKRTYIFITGILIVCLTAILLCSCSMFKTDEEKIEARILNFLTAYNSGDMDGVLESLDSKTRNTYRATINIVQGIAGMKFDISDLFAVSIGTMSETDALTIEILEININDDENATVNAIMSYKDNIQQASDNVVLTMIKENNEWYIKNIENK